MTHVFDFDILNEVLGVRVCLCCIIDLADDYRSQSRRTVLLLGHEQDTHTSQRATWRDNLPIIGATYLATSWTVA